MLIGARFELGVGRRKKEQYRTGQEKVTKGLYFTYLGRSPHTSDLHQEFCSRWPSWRNHVRQVSKWNFQGLNLPFTGVKFPFSYWFLNGRYNSGALLRCLWYMRVWMKFRSRWRWIIKRETNSDYRRVVLRVACVFSLPESVLSFAACYLTVCSICKFVLYFCFVAIFCTFCGPFY